MSRLNKLAPDKEAIGNHTSFIENIKGQILKYATYIRNFLNPTGFDEEKRVDLSGNSHFNKTTGEIIDTPHVHEKGVLGEVRKANKNEIPLRAKKKEDNNDKS